MPTSPAQDGVAPAEKTRYDTWYKIPHTIFMAISVYTTTLRTKREVAHNAWQFTLRKPADFTFHAGQYVFLDFANPVHRDERPTLRAMSIASAPEEDDLLFLMRLSDSAFKKNMAALQPGEEIVVKGPLGHCALPEDSHAPVVLIVAGVGITPARSMLMHEVAARSTRSFVLLYSNKYENEIAYHHDLATVPLAHYRYVPTLTREEGTWDGERGRIDAAMIARYVDDVDNTMYYVVGTKEFIISMREVLTQMHVPAMRIIFDNFG